MVWIAGKLISDCTPVFIIAEAGVNHNGSAETARRMIDAAAAAGANAVKFQTFKAEALTTRKAEKAAYQKRATGTGETQYEMLKRLELSYEQQIEIAKYCAEREVVFLSTPFDRESVDFLEELGVPAYKISSGEVTNLPLLDYIARKGKPMLISTGMSTLGEVEEAVETVRKAGNEQIILLHCTSSYPASYQDVNLRAMLTLKEAFHLPVGYSDHTLGIEVALAAVALGARVIEKHFTLDRNMPGPDHMASLEPEELKRMVHGIRCVEAALGDGRKRCTAAEEEVKKAARKSIVAACTIPPGTTIREELLAVKRPGTGLPPKFISLLVGRRTKREVPKDALIDLSMLE